MQKPTPGSKWRHYKSTTSDERNYEVIDIALHSETEEDTVIYRPLYEVREDSCIYGYNMIARPLSNWFDIVERDGKKIQRFTELQ